MFYRITIKQKKWNILKCFGDGLYLKIPGQARKKEDDYPYKFYEVTNMVSWIKDTFCVT